MWYDIFVVDHSVDCWDFLSNMADQFLIADSRTSEVMDFHWNIREPVCELQPIDQRQSRTKTMASAQNFRNPIEFDNSFSSSQQSFLIKFKICHESQVNIAASASEIWLHLEIEILNPILVVVASPPRNHHSLGGGIIADIADSLRHAILNIGDIDQPGVFGSCVTCPRLHTVFGAKGDGSV